MTIQSEYKNILQYIASIAIANGYRKLKESLGRILTNRQQLRSWFNIQFNFLHHLWKWSRDCFLTWVEVFSRSDCHPRVALGVGPRVTRKCVAVTTLAQAAPCSPQAVVGEGEVYSLVASYGAFR